MVRRIDPPKGSFKCNNDGSGKGSMAFCVINGEGDFIYTESRVLEEVTVIETKIKAIRMGLDYCLHNRLVPLIVETYSLTT